MQIFRSALLKIAPKLAIPAEITSFPRKSRHPQQGMPPAERHVILSEAKDLLFFAPREETPP